MGYLMRVETFLLFVVWLCYFEIEKWYLVVLLEFGVGYGFYGIVWSWTYFGCGVFLVWMGERGGRVSLVVDCFEFWFLIGYDKVFFVFLVDLWMWARVSFCGIVGDYWGLF